MTDHYAEALKHIDWIHEWQSYEGDTPEANLANGLVAQTHATLALVEQQRIANIIALSQAEDGNGWLVKEPLDALFTYVSSEDYDPDGDNGLRIHPDIKKGLGL